MSQQLSRLDPPAALATLGRPIFALAIIALGVENIVCASTPTHSLGPNYEVISVLPWLPAIPWLGYLFGAVVILCAVGLLLPRTLRSAALILGTLLFACTVVLETPKYAAAIGSIPLRTGVLEPLSLACVAWLLPGPGAIPRWLERASRWLLGVSMIVFGIDHFLALIFIANLIPAWIPFHVFWVAFFGMALIAAGISIGLNVLSRWGSALLGLMFGIWVVTLHLPRVLGLYGIPNAPHNPNEWSSLFIATALWGGLWALSRSGPLHQKRFAALNVKIC